MRLVSNTDISKLNNECKAENIIKEFADKYCKSFKYIIKDNINNGNSNSLNGNSNGNNSMNTQVTPKSEESVLLNNTSNNMPVINLNVSNPLSNNPSKEILLVKGNKNKIQF